jgi:hypothetical protein
VRRGAALLLAASLLAAPAAAEVRRFEVVGAVALDPAAPPAAPRQAALRAALEEAVARAARELLRQSTGPEAAPDAPAPAVPGEPSEYAVSYRVLEDRGEQDALVAGGTGGREYVVVAEVQIDLDRVRAALGASGGLPVGSPASAPPAEGTFRLELLGLPSPAAWTAVRSALGRAGATSVVPLELEAGRVLVEVRSGLGAERTLDRLVHDVGLGAGIGLEALPEAGGLRRLQVREGAPPPPPPESLPEGAPEAASPEPAAD